MKTIGYASLLENTELVPYHFERRALRANDVAIEILYSGICHSDLHTLKGDWGDQHYPLVPGHEIVGRVIEVGTEVKKFTFGDHVAIGCMVDSCQTCDQCEKHQEQYCRNGSTLTYGSIDKISGEVTQGGYSKHIVAREEFVLKVSDKLDISKTAPILCAGITTYSPLKKWNVKKGTRVAVIGLGGLGHMAVKFALAMGAEVTVISRSHKKQEDAKELGVTNFLISSDREMMSKSASAFDLIIDTIPVKHDLNIYTPLLDIDGTLVLVGQIGMMDEVFSVPLILGRRRVAGSVIGGIQETQEVLNFCAENNIHPECKIISVDEINCAWDDLYKGNPSYRYVIDMKSLEV